MITYTKRGGYTYKDETTGKEYELFEMVSLGGETTSDMIAIWDQSNGLGGTFVNWVAGASCMEARELNDTVAEYVKEYEAKQAEEKRAAPEISYRFTKGGISAFSCDVVDDICDHGICEPYRISHGNRSIELPDLAEIHQLLENFLEDALEEAEA